MQIGLCTPLPSPAVQERLASAGCDYLEPTVAGAIMEADAATFDRETDIWQAGALAPKSANVLLPGHLSVVGEAVDRDALEAYLTEAFRRVRALGIEVVVFGSGAARRRPEGFALDEATRQFSDALRLAAQAAGPEVTVCLEHLRQAETNMVNSFAAAGELAEELDVKNLALVVDGYHLAEEDESPQVVTRFPSLVRHVHVAGAGRRAPLPDDAEQLRGLFEQLVAIGYDGRCSLECRWGDRDAEAAVSLAAVRAVAEEVGLA